MKIISVLLSVFSISMGSIYGMNVHVDYLDHIRFYKDNAGVFIDVQVTEEKENFNFTVTVYDNPACTLERPVVLSKFSDANLEIIKSGESVSNINLTGMNKEKKRIFTFTVNRQYIKESLFLFYAVQSPENPNSTPIGSAIVFEVYLWKMVHPWKLCKGDFFEFCRQAANKKAKEKYGIAPFKGKNHGYRSENGYLLYKNTECSYIESTSDYFTTVVFTSKGITSIKVDSYRKKNIKEDIKGLKEAYKTMNQVCELLKEERGAHSESVERMKNEIAKVKKQIDKLESEKKKLK